MKKFFFFLLFIVLLGQGCQNKCSHEQSNANEHLTYAVLFQQKSAEYKALCYQAFNVASMMLELDLADEEISLPRALVFDIDETILDNSPYEGKCILEGISYPDQWNEWCHLAIAKAIPGALDFINEASEKGYAIFYVTNRKEELREVTAKNLLSEGFPLSDEKFLLMRTDENSKETRRNIILDEYHISMLFGDNLGDFCHVFNNADMEERDKQTNDLRHKFGTKYIVLPNAMYGDWVMALYDYNTKLSVEEQKQKRKNLLISF